MEINIKFAQDAIWIINLESVSAVGRAADVDAIGSLIKT